MHPLANRPNLCLGRQRGQARQRIVHHHFVEPAHQSLIGAEDDGVHRGVAGGPRRHLRVRRAGFGRSQADAEPQFDRVGVIGDGSHRPFVLPDGRSCGGFHRAHHRFQVAGAADLAA